MHNCRLAPRMEKRAQAIQPRQCQGEADGEQEGGITMSMNEEDR